MKSTKNVFFSSAFLKVSLGFPRDMLEHRRGEVRLFLVSVGSFGRIFEWLMVFEHTMKAIEQTCLHCACLEHGIL